jgi:hypothetical protein
VRTLLQLVDAVGHDHVADRKAFADRDHVALRSAHGHRAHFDRVIRLDYVDERALLTALQAGRRDQNRVGDCADEQPRVDELIREQRVVLIGESRLEFDGPVD